MRKKMPIVIKDFSWRQTDTQVIIRIPVKDVNLKDVDIFFSKYYIKVHYAPFLFEACLYSAIDEDSSKCTLGKGEAVLELNKNESEVWPRLTKDISKREAIDIKLQAIDRAQAKSKEQLEQKKASKDKRQKDGVSEAMGLESKERTRIDSIKNALKEKANKEIEEFKINQSKELAITFGEKAAISTQQISASDTKERKKWKKPKEVQVEKDTTTPGIRDSSSISVSFTPRAFPTPSRESFIDQETEWLKKQAEARRASGFVAEDLRPEENNPQWLLDKGRSFCEVGNYIGAVSAFTHAIKLCDKMAELYVARSTAQIGLKNYRRVILDTNKAQELLRPHCEANAALRFTCHMNTGRALLDLNMPKQALGELEYALELRPFDEPCSALIDSAEHMLENYKEEELPKTTYLEPKDLE